MSKYKFGNISATNMQVGDNATMTVTQGGREEISELIKLLRTQIQQAAIPENAKNELTVQVVPALEQATHAPDPKPGLGSGLTRLNDNLERIGITTDKVSGIVGTVAKIASAAGIAIHTVAPFVAGLL